MEPLKQTEDRIRKIKPDIETPAAMDSRILMDSYAAMDSGESTAILSGHYKSRRIKMKSISKFAAAAIILIGVSAIFLFNSGPGSVVLADVYETVQQAQAFMYKLSMTINGEMMEGLPPGRTKINGVVTVSTEHGMKMETTLNEIDTLNITKQNQPFHQLLYLVPDKKSIVSVVPSQKIYQNIEFSDDLCERIKKQNCDPREMIKQMLACEYTDLGRSEINGITVQGFETSDPAYSGGVFAGSGTVTLWVDVETWLPVQSEMSFTMEPNAELLAVISDFQWNLPLTAEDFQPNIPADYKSMGSMKVPEMTEEAALEGLQFYADLFGHYPAAMDLMGLIKEGSQKIAENAEIIQQMAEIEKSSDQNTGESMSQLMQKYVAPIQSLGMFWMTLVQDKKDPAYFGSQVTPDDVDAVLMRWKISGDTYRVVFGDLNIAQMQYDELVQIEPEIVPAPQPEPNVSSTLTDEQLKMNYTSMKNVKKMVMACWSYSQKHDGQWPEKLQDLIEEGLSSDVFINPHQPDNPDGYVYLKPAEKRPGAAQTVVIYEAYDMWGIGINVGFLDGHVEFIRDEQKFEDLLSQ